MEKLTRDEKDVVVDALGCLQRSAERGSYVRWFDDHAIVVEQVGAVRVSVGKKLSVGAPLTGNEEMFVSDALLLFADAVEVGVLALIGEKLALSPGTLCV